MNSCGRSVAEALDLEGLWYKPASAVNRANARADRRSSSRTGARATLSSSASSRTSRSTLGGSPRPTSSDLTFPALGGIEGAMRRFPPGSAPFASLLLAVIVGLPVLAYASPPDPSWVHGVYDDADFDDIVCLITTSSGLVADLCAACGSPPFILTDAELPRNKRWIVSSSLTSPQPRAPPSP